jgi:hypothetical protein
MNMLLTSCGIAIDVYSLHAVYNNMCYQFTYGIFGSNKISYNDFKIKLYVDNLHTLNIHNSLSHIAYKTFYHVFYSHTF